MCDIKVLNNKCYEWYIWLGRRRTRSLVGLKPTNHVKVRDQLAGFCFCFIRLFFCLFFFVLWFFLTDLKTSLNNFISVNLTVISPHHRRLCFYFWTFVCSNYDIFHLLGTDKGRCKTTLAQNTHNHLNRLLYLYKCK